MMMVAFAESRKMDPPKSSFMSKKDKHKPVPTLEFTQLSSSSQSSRNEHQASFEFRHFGKKVEAYKTTSTDSSQKGRGHK